MKKWCWNSKTGEIFNYNESGNLTDFPRGTFLAYGDYLITGFKTEEEAISYSEDHGNCYFCKGSSTYPVCFRCNHRTIQIKKEYNK